VGKYISSAEIRNRRIAAHSSEISFGRPRRIADACGRDQLQPDLTAAISQEFLGRKPIVCGSLFNAVARASATAANATMRV
jgi:hypothetical protein